MLKIIFITVLMVEFVNELFNKFDLHDRFKKYAMRSKSKFIYQLSNCDFCKNFHIGVIMLVLVTVLSKFNILYILTPFCVSGALKLIKNDSKS